VSGWIVVAPRVLSKHRTGVRHGDLLVAMESMRQFGAGSRVYRESDGALIARMTVPT
jgi:hypothetical protein